MRAEAILRRNGWRTAKGVWVNPASGRVFTKERALNKLARDDGFKSYQEFQKVSKLKVYRKFAAFAKEYEGKEQTLGSMFVKAYRKAASKNFKRGSKQLEDLLVESGKRVGNEAWPPGETPTFKR